MDDKGRLWMDGKLVGEKTFEETGVLREKQKLNGLQEGENRHERRKREALLRKLMAV